MNDNEITITLSDNKATSIKNTGIVVAAEALYNKFTYKKDNKDINCLSVKVFNQELDLKDINTDNGELALKTTLIDLLISNGIIVTESEESVIDTTKTTPVILTNKVTGKTETYTVKFALSTPQVANSVLLNEEKNENINNDEVINDTEISNEEVEADPVDSTDNPIVTE